MLADETDYERAVAYTLAGQIRFALAQFAKLGHADREIGTVLADLAEDVGDVAREFDVGVELNARARTR
jgi:hypothetical protein